MTNCIFCKIINKEIPSEVVYEDEKTIVFKDIHPKAPIHLLVVPKEHLSTINDLKTENSEFAGNLILVAKTFPAPTSSPKEKPPGIAKIW